MRKNRFTPLHPVKFKSTGKSCSLGWGVTGFTIDNFNRLTLKKGGVDLPIEGEFSVDGNNRLIYRLNQPAEWRRKYGFPDKLVFCGSWELNENYDLELRLSRQGGFFTPGSLALKGEIISVEPAGVIFEVKSVDARGSSHIRLIKLSGTWTANEYNQLSFTVKKEAPGTLILRGAWKLNQNQEIAYTYTKTDLRTGKRSSYLINFKGFWEISSNQRLAYILSTGGASRFDFRVQLETPNIYPAKGEIKYRIGIGAKQAAPKKQTTIILYGAWKFSRNLGLVFEMESSRGKFRTAYFGAEVDLSRRDEIIFSINSVQGKPMGFKLIFSHKFLKKLDARAFVRLQKLRQEYGVDVGIKIPF